MIRRNFWQSLKKILYVGFRATSNFRKFDLKEIVAISFAAKILGHTFLLETTTQLLKVLFFVANFKFKMKNKVMPTVDKVLDNCAEMVASWQTF